MKYHYRRLFTIVIVVLVSAGIGFSVSCRAVRERAKELKMEKLKSATPEGCVNYTGTWDTNLGSLEIIQEECEMNGVLYGNGGGIYKLEGTITDETCDFSWGGPGGAGLGYFKMDETKNKFVGEYGEGEQNTGNGVWDGTRVE